MRSHEWIDNKLPVHRLVAPPEPPPSATKHDSQGIKYEFAKASRAPLSREIPQNDCESERWDRPRRATKEFSLVNKSGRNIKDAIS